MGSGVSLGGRPNFNATVEPLGENVFEDNNIVIKTATVLELPNNTLVSCQSCKLADLKTQICVFVEGPGVLKIGLTTTDPSQNEKILDGSVFEIEEGFDGRHQHRRVLNRHPLGWYYYGQVEAERMFDPIQKSDADVWLYIIFVYGKPEVNVHLYHDDTDDDNFDEIELCPLSKEIDNIEKAIKPNTGVFKLSSPIKDNFTYHIHWDMRHGNEKIAGRSQLEHGFLRLCLETKQKKSGTSETVWECGSAVKEFPFSSVIAFSMNSWQKTVTHNNIVNSVGKTKTDKFRSGVKGSKYFMTVEFSSGQINVTGSRKALVRQEAGSSLLVLEHPIKIKEDFTTDDVLREIAAHTDFSPRRVQFGSTTKMFVVEFSEHLDETEIKNLEQDLECKLQALSETKMIQVISQGKRDVSKDDLEQYFTRKDYGGGKIELISRADTIPYCWIITFEKSRVASRLWMMKTHTIKDNKLFVLPYYNSLGLAASCGEVPKYDRSPLESRVDWDKLSFITRRQERKQHFIDEVTRTVKVNIRLPEMKQDSTAELQNSEAVVTFECQLSLDDEDELAIWKAVCQKSVDVYFQKFVHVQEMSVEEGKWEDAIKFAIDINEVDCRAVKGDHKLRFIGANLSKIQEAEKKICDLLGKPDIVTRPIAVDLEKYLALDAEGKLRDISEKCSATSMKINRSKKIVTFQGPEDEVEKAELEVLKLAGGIRLISLQVNEEIMQLAETEKGKEGIADCLRKLGRSPEFFISGYNIKVYAHANDKEEDNLVKEMLDAIQRMSVCRVVGFADGEVQFLKDHRWERRRQEIMDRASGPLLVTAGKRNVKLCGTEEMVRLAEKAINDYIQLSKMDHENIDLSYEQMEFFNQFCNPDDDSNLEILKDKNGSLIGQISVRGKLQEVRAFRQIIQEKIQNVITYWFYMKKEWLVSAAAEVTNLWTFGHGQEALVYIDIGQSLAEQGISGVAVLTCGAIIQVRQGDITLETTDVIVNVVTGDGHSFDRGLAKYLCHSKHGGEKIKEEFTKKLKEYQSKNFPAGHVIQTGSGNLRCIKVMHVVPPDWVDGQQGEHNQMKALVKRILKLSEENGKESVSMPALILRGFPEDIAISAMMEAVSKYLSKKNCKIKEVILCDSSASVKEKLTEALGTLQDPWFVFRHGLPIKAEDLMESIGRRRMQYSRPAPSMRWGQISQHTGVGGASKEDVFKGGLPFKLLYGKIELEIKNGDLTQEQVEVLVSTTPKFPNLDGEVAKAVLSVGGASILQECKQLGQMQEGEIRKTGPGNLPVSIIFHAQIPWKWDPHAGPKFVYDLVQTCLKEAEKEGKYSVAFPVIGAGNSGFPADIVAEYMLKGVNKFSKENRSIVQKVYIVVYYKAEGICKMFEETIPKLFSKPGTDSSSEETVPHHRHRGSKEFKISANLSLFAERSDADDIVLVKVVSKNKGPAIQRELERILKDYYQDKKLTFCELARTQPLSKSEEKRIKDLQKKFGVSIDIDEQNCCITLSGLATRVSKCEFEAWNLITNEFERDRLRIKEENIISAKEQWYFQQDGVTEPVCLSTNYELWKGHQTHDDFSYVDIETGVAYYVRYISDGQLETWPINRPQQKRQLFIQKKKESEIVFPPKWTGADVAQVTLADHEAEHSFVKNEFMKAGCNQKQIDKITRIENRSFWRQYQLKKQYMEKVNPQGENERFLWHGTDADTAQKIIHGGYNRSFAGKNLTVYGEGVYFALESSYSDRDTYAKPDANGVKRMFYNRVLTGVYTVGNSNMKVLPPRPGITVDGIPVPFDSAVDNAHSPGMFVIFHDAQVYPEYLIEYKN